MAWQPINHWRRANSAFDAAIGVSVGKSARLRIYIAKRCLPPGWGPGTRLEASLGAGEDFGKLRLAASGIRVFALHVLPGRPCDFVYVGVTLPDGADRVARAREPVAVQTLGDAIVLTLPAWARPKLARAPEPIVRNVTAAVLGDPSPARRAAAQARR